MDRRIVFGELGCTIRAVFRGCLLYYLMKNHCFVDGNKRVGWAACMEVLRALGLTVTATDKEAEDFELLSNVVDRRA